MTVVEKVSTGDNGEEWGAVRGVHFAPDEKLSGDMTIGDAIATEAGQEQIRRIEEANDRARENMRRENEGVYEVDGGTKVDGEDAEADFENIEGVEKAAERFFDTLSVNEQGALVMDICKDVTGEDFLAIRKESEERQEEVRNLVQAEMDRREASGELEEWLERRRAREKLSIPKESEERLREIEVREAKHKEEQSRIDSLENSMKGARGSYNRSLDAAETFERVESAAPERIEQKEASRRIYIGHLESVVKLGAEGGEIDRSTVRFYLQKAGKDVDEIRQREDDDPEKRVLGGEIDEATLREAMKEGGAERKEIEIEMAERGVRVAEAGIAAVKLRREELNGNTDDGKMSRIAKKAVAPFRFMKKDELESELRRADGKLREAERRLEETKAFYRGLEWDALSPEEKEAKLQAKWEREERERRLVREKERRFRERQAAERRSREEAKRQAQEEAKQTEDVAEEESQEKPVVKKRRGVPKRGVGMHARRD